MRSTWVNVYKGLYAQCRKGAKYYVSLGYNTKALALKALESPKSKGIRKRFIATVMIELPVVLIPQPVFIVCERVLFGTLQPVFRKDDAIMVWKKNVDAQRYLIQVVKESGSEKREYRYDIQDYEVVPATLIGEQLICTYNNRTYEMLRTDEQWKPKK